MDNKFLQRLKIMILFFGNISLGLSGYCQSIKQVETFEKKYQVCLDSNIAMKVCALNFYDTSDSLLIVAYKNLKVKLKLTEQEKLKRKQKEWLKKRDTYFVKAYNQTIQEYGNQPDSEDFKMIYFDAKSKFIIIRLKELIKIRIKNKVKK